MFDRRPLSTAYVAHGGAAACAALRGRVAVRRHGVAVAAGGLTFAGDDARTFAFDSLQLPVAPLDPQGGEVIVTVRSESVCGPLVVAHRDRVEVGFPFFDWEARCLGETYVDRSQPLYSRLPVSYGVIPFPVRAGLLRLAGAVRRGRAAITGAKAVHFPEYPVCGVVDRLRAAILAAAVERSPSAARSRLLVLTHDMDELAAEPGIEKLRSIERRHGIVSAWGILSSKYRLPTATVEALLREGCEIFSHGYLHDGRLPYLPRAEQLRRLQHFFEAYPMLRGHTRGFRCGQLARNHSLYAAVQEVFAFDMTPPTSERNGPYGARSGVSTVFPFWSEGGLLHLPLTLPQDYYLAFVERLPAAAIAARWIAAAEQVLGLGGIGVHLVHPDNVLSEPALLDAYDRFLTWARRQQLDIVLPGEVAQRIGPRPSLT